MSSKPELELTLEDSPAMQSQLVEMLQRFDVLQDQFNQLTNHTQECYRRIEALHKMVTSKVLS